MAKFAYTKGELHKQREQLRLYQRVLPSLDLKHKQLTTEHQKAKNELQVLKTKETETLKNAINKIPMAANKAINLSGLVMVKEVKKTKVNILGVSLPKLLAVECAIKSYSFLTRPHWVDTVATNVQRIVELRVAISVQQEKVDILASAVRKTIQRVNLLDKLLIPNTQNIIRKIQIALADIERTAVVRAKIAKSKSTLNGL